MKNFRKVLALILVVATLCSFVAMASAKTTADYADASEVKYVEAVDVLSAIGILKGYDGKFHPADEIDRDEMAKMIAVLANGGEDNADLFVGANTFADVKGTWAEGYVAYAAQIGIINGRNATTFDPDAKVTGVEVLKMLLCTLGYNAKEQGYVGANWQVNVLRDAKKANLMAGLKDFNAYAPASRDEAAQMMFNALKAYMVVGYVSENIVDISNSLYINVVETEKGDIVLGDISLKDAEKSGWEIAYCNAVISTTPLWTIFDEIKVAMGYAEDCFDRPGHKWVVKAGKETILDKYYADEPVYAQTEGDSKAVKAAAKDYDKDMLWDVYVDGADLEEDLTYDELVDAIDAGNGVLVELYDNGAVVVVNTYIAEVGKVNEYYNYFYLVNDAEEDNEMYKFALNDYEVEEGDIVLYWTCDGSVEGDDANVDKLDNEVILHDLKVIEGKAVEIAEGFDYGSMDASYVIAAGETYKYAHITGKVLSADDSIDVLKWADVKDSNAYTLYFDEYGFIKYYHVTAPAATEYTYTYLVEGTLEAHKHGYTIKADGTKVYTVDYKADMVNYGTDGTLTVSEDVVVAENVETALTVNALFNKTGVLAKVWDDEGKTTVAVDDDDKLIVGAFAKAGTKLSNTEFKLGEGLYANSKTVFMIRTKGLDGKYTYEQVTGYKNLKGSYVAKDVNEEVTNIQYFVNPDHPAFASYVFIDAVYTHDFDTTVIVLGAAKYDAFNVALKELYDDDYTAYSVLVAGEEAILLVEEDKTGELASATKYDVSLSYIGVTQKVGEKDLPIYTAKSEVAKVEGDVVTGCVYEVVEGETYVWFKNDVVNTEGKVLAEAKEMLMLAEDALVLTLTANKVDGELVADYYEGILEVEGEGNEIDHCYVTIKDGVVTELIKIDNNFIASL